MMLDPLSLSLAVVALLLSGSALSLEVSRWWTLRLVAHTKDQQRVTLLEQEMQIFSRLIEQTLAARLIAPSHPEMSRLLNKLSMNTISIEDARMLHRLVMDESTALQLKEPEAPDLSFPRLMTLWSLEVRIARAGAMLTQPLTGHKVP